MIIADPAARGNSVTSVRLDGAAERLRAWCAAQAGVTLGIGLGMESAVDWLRIAHMGHVNAHMTLGALSAMEAGLRALGVPRGDGALNAATEAIAGA